MNRKDPADMSRNEARRKPSGVGRVFRPGVVALAARIVSLVCGLFSELSDQRAYAQHLQAHGRTHSAAEWRRFSDERLKAKFGRPKCC
jgi:hypothetical protein